MKWPRILKDKTIVAWALYDWANSAFATTVMAGFFPIFFRHYGNQGVSAETATLRLGLANSLAGLLVVLLAPLLAAAADRRMCKKMLLLIFTLLGALATSGLALVTPGSWERAALLYTLALVGFSGAIIFYDAFLPAVSRLFTSAEVSSLGYALGYLGGGILFGLNVCMYLQPEWFSLNSAEVAVKASFVTVGLWWLFFSLPAFLCLKEDSARGGAAAEPLSKTALQLWQTFKELSRTRPIFLFLLAYWLYIDALNTVVKMAVDYGAALGFSSSHLISALLMVQFIGFPSAIAYGMIGRHVGIKRAISAGIMIYMGVTLWAAYMEKVWQFYVLAGMVALVQGGVQALSRSFYAEMIPEARSAQYFCFYNLVGKFAAILGPLLVGASAYLSGSTRAGILPLFVMFSVGLLLLRRIPKSPKTL